MENEIVSMPKERAFLQELTAGLGIPEAKKVNTHFNFTGADGQTHLAESISEGVLFRLLESLHLTVIDHYPFVSEKLHIKTHFDFYVKEWDAYIEVNGAQHWQSALSKKDNLFVNDYVKRLDAMNHKRTVIDIDSRLIRVHPLNVLGQLTELNQMILANQSQQQSTPVVITLSHSHQLMQKEHKVVSNKFAVTKEADTDPKVNAEKLEKRSMIWHDDTNNRELKDVVPEELRSVLAARGLSEEQAKFLVNTHVMAFSKDGDLIFSREYRFNRGIEGRITDLIKAKALKNLTLPNDSLPIQRVDQRRDKNSLWHLSPDHLRLTNAQTIRLFNNQLDLMAYFMKVSRHNPENKQKEILAVFDRNDPKVFPRALHQAICKNLKQLISMDRHLDFQVGQIAEAFKIKAVPYTNESQPNQEPDLDDSPAR